MNSLWKVLVIVLLASNVFLLYALNQNITSKNYWDTNNSDNTDIFDSIEEKLSNIEYNLENIEYNTSWTKDGISNLESYMSEIEDNTSDSSDHLWDIRYNN